MRRFFKYQLSFIILLLISCSSRNKIEENKMSKIYNFNNLVGWRDFSLNKNGAINYSIDKGNLKIYTNENTWERTKIKTVVAYTFGIYNWRVYVPEMGVGDRASIGAFLFHDDAHELDFEIGYGTQVIRNQLAAQADDLIVYMTSQGHPFHSIHKKIKREQWYNLSLELTKNSIGHYKVNWKINNILMGKIQLTYGEEKRFTIFCSLENLKFMGDHIPLKQNYALFDYVEFKEN